MQDQISNPTPAVFSFNSLDVRVVDRDGEPWFVAADVCAALTIEKHRDAVSRLDDDERGSVVVDTLGGRQEVTAINESGLYSLTLTSRKPEAKKFKKWVTSEVLPQIRKTGSYGTAAALPSDPMAILELTFAALKNQTKAIAEVKSDVRFLKENIRLHAWQCYDLRLAVTRRVNEFHDKTGIERKQFYSGIWHRLKLRMQVNSYQAIPAVRFDEAVEYVQALTLSKMPDYIKAQMYDGLQGGVA